MALVKCNECGKVISDNAVTCVHCGNTRSKYINTKNLSGEEKRRAEEINQMIFDGKIDNLIKNKYTKMGWWYGNVRLC